MEESENFFRFIQSQRKSKRYRFKQFGEGIKALFGFTNTKRQGKCKNPSSPGEIYESATATKINGFWRCYIPFLDIELEEPSIDFIINDIYELYQGDYNLEDVYVTYIGKSQRELNFVFNIPERSKIQMVEEPTWWESFYNRRKL